MFIIKSRIKINGSVLHIQKTDKCFILLDNLYNLYILDAESLQFEKTVNVTKQYDPWHRYAKSLAVSRNGFVNFVMTKSSKAIVLFVDGTDIKKKTTLGWHKADISKSSFSANGRYLATGGEDGQTIVYKLPSFNLVTSLFPKSDYISTIVFSDDASLMASAGFDKTVTVFDFERNVEIAEFESDDVIEDMTFFNDDQKLFFICKNGSTGVFSLAKKEIEEQSKQVESWLTSLVVTGDKRYAIIGGKNEYLFVVRMRDNAKLFSVKMEHIGVSTLKLVDNLLFVGYIDGVIEAINLSAYEDEMDIHLKVNDFQKARDVTERNHFLKIYTPYIQKLSDTWREVLQKAVDLLAKNKITAATEVVGPFVEDPKRKQEFSFYMSQKQHIAEFMDAIEAKKVTDAYALAEANPDIKTLSAYEELENYWKKIFETAKKLLADNAQLNQGKATELLKPFANVKSKKDLVYTLLRNTDKYVMGDKALKERNFAKYFALADKFPFLKETEVYRKTLMLGEQLVEKFSQLENDRDYAKAKELLKLLSTLSPFKRVAVERSALVDKKELFLDAIEKKELQVAYDLIESSPDLKAMPEFISLNNLFKKASEAAYNQAFAGKPNEVMELLEEYFEIFYWIDKVASIMKVAYLNEIKIAALGEGRGGVHWGHTLQAFIDRFGKSDDLKKICEVAKIKPHLDGIASEGDTAGYKQMAYLGSILVYEE